MNRGNTHKYARQQTLGRAHKVGKVWLSALDNAYHKVSQVLLHFMKVMINVEPNCLITGVLETALLSGPTSYEGSAFLFSLTPLPYPALYG